MNDAELNLRAALDYIEKVGWVKGWLHDANNRVCSLGGVQDVCGIADGADNSAWLAVPGVLELTETAYEMLGMEPLGDTKFVTRVADFNDRYYTSFDDVKRMFELAIKKVRAGNIGEPERHIEFEPLEAPAAPQETPVPAPATPEQEPAPV